MIELRRIELPMARESTAADFQVGDIVGHEEDIDEYEVLALHPYPGHPNSDTMTLRCLVEERDGEPYMKKGEVYDCCKCRRYDLKRRSQSR